MTYIIDYYTPLFPEIPELLDLGNMLLSLEYVGGTNLVKEGSAAAAAQVLGKWTPFPAEVAIWKNPKPHPSSSSAFA